MNETDKQALIDGSATIPYRITIIGDTESENEVLTEYDIVNTTYEDYRYVDTATLCIGQFVARTISGELMNPNNSIIMENKEIKVELGVKTESGTNYYSLGNFLITKPSDDAVKDKTSFEAMDYTKKFNKEFDATGLTFPCTALQLAQFCCQKCGVELGSTSFTNGSFVIDSNQYETGDTFRKVMQDIGKLAYSWVRIGWDNKCYIDFSFSSTVADTNKIGTSNYYDLTVQSEKFGPVNRVVIGMSDIEGENVVLEDSTSIAQNGVCELQIMDNNLTYTPELRQQAIASANKLFGLSFVPIEINTTGHPWLLGNETVEIEKLDGTKIKTIPFDRTIEYAGHIKTKLVSKADTKTETEYKNPGTLETAIKQTRIIVNKQEQEISQVIQQQESQTEIINSVQDSIDNLTEQINENIIIYRGNGVPTLDNYPANEWTTTELKDDHVGDLYYNTEDGKTYRFDKNGVIFSWVEEKPDLSEAIELAQNALNVANDKMQVFVTQPTPPYEVGDLWTDGDDIFVCKTSKTEGQSFSASDWENATNYAEQIDTTNVKLNETVSNLDGTNSTIADLTTTLNNNYLTTDQINAIVEGQDSDIEAIEGNISQIMTDAEGLALRVTTIETDGVSKVSNTLIELGEDGIEISKSTDEFSSKFDNKGVTFMSYGNVVATYDKDGANIPNLTSEEAQLGYLSIKKGETNGEKRTKIYWVGD